MLSGFSWQARPHILHSWELWGCSGVLLSEGQECCSACSHLGTKIRSQTTPQGNN